jgi:hypothetical protein
MNHSQDCPAQGAILQGATLFFNAISFATPATSLGIKGALKILYQGWTLGVHHFNIPGRSTTINAGATHTSLITCHACFSLSLTPSTNISSLLLTEIFGLNS